MDQGFAAIPRRFVTGAIGEPEIRANQMACRTHEPLRQGLVQRGPGARVSRLEGSRCPGLCKPAPRRFPVTKKKMIGARGGRWSMQPSPLRRPLIGERELRLSLSWRLPSTRPRLAPQGGPMNKGAARTISLRLLVAFVMLATPWARAGDTPESTMGPVDPYLMANREAEVALARSAAPPSISADATVLVLTRHGFQTARGGENGVVCVVARSWSGGFHDPGFWTPKVRGPGCFNPPAARSILPITLKRTEMVLAGRSKAEIASAIKTALEKKELPPLRP